MRVEAGDRQARAGDAEVAAQGLGGDQAGVDDGLDGEQAGHLGQRLVDGDQADAQVAGGEHHHRPAGAVEAGGGGQLGQEFGVAGEGEAGLIERRLGDGRGDQPARLAGEREARGGLDPADDRPGRRGGGFPRDHRRRQGQIENRQGVFEHRRRLGRVGHRPDASRRPRPRRRRQRSGVSDHHEGGAAVAQRQPGLDDDLRADAGGIAQAEREGRGRHRVSMVAEFRKSRSVRLAIMASS